MKWGDILHTISPVLGLAGDIFGGNSARSAQNAANKANLKLQQQQQGWEEGMANTAIQRRKADITAAGGNPALAFTGGGEAATPSVAPARMEATVKPGQYGTSNMMNAIQAQNIQANTALQLAQAKATGMKNNITNAFGMANAEADLNAKLQKIDVTQRQWEALGQHIQTELIKQKNLALTGKATALQNARYEEMTRAVVSLALSQAKTAAIDVAALQDKVETMGFSSLDSSGIVKQIIDAVRTINTGLNQ